jgi:hypothetical protein
MSCGSSKFYINENDTNKNSLYCHCLYVKIAYIKPTNKNIAAHR